MRNLAFTLVVLQCALLIATTYKGMSYKKKYIQSKKFKEIILSEKEYIEVMVDQVESVVNLCSDKEFEIAMYWAYIYDELNKSKKKAEYASIKAVHCK